MASEFDLKPCPFCGRNDIREEIKDGGGMGDYYAVYFICWGCGATSGMKWNILDEKDKTGSILMDEKDVIRGARKLWNKRI